MAKPEWTREQVVNELDSNNHWINHDTITYQIDGLNRTTILDESSNTSTGIHTMTSAQRSAAQQAFALWDDLIPLTIKQTHDRDADISLNFTSFSGQHFAAASLFKANHSDLPQRSQKEQGIYASNIWIPDHPSSNGDSIDYAGSKFEFGTHQFSTFVHEIGHSLGLHHPGEYNAEAGKDFNYDDDALFAKDTVQYSIMSYFAPWHYDPNVTYKVNGQDPLIEPSTPMLYDIAAIQAIYGYDAHTRNGNTTYGFHSSFSVAGINSVYNFSVNDPPVMTIYDAGGNDTFDVSAYHQTQIIDLRPGFFSSVGGLTQNVAMAYNTGKGANPNAVIENAVGGAGSDLIIGNDADNKLEGRGGNDALNGGIGNDNLDGGAGADTMLGGAGDDTYFVDDAGDYISEMENLTDLGGNDTIRTNLTFYQLANDPRSQIENLTFVLPKAFTGIGNYLDNVITGNAGADFLQGNEGNDTLVSGGGQDSMIGGIGNDTYVITGALAIVVEGEDSGVDEVQTDLSSYTLGDGVENLTLMEKGSGYYRPYREGNGNALDNRIYGESLRDQLSGNDGNDYLSGLDGNDRLYGNNADDTLRGGGGDDLLDGGDGSDTADYKNTSNKTMIDLAAGTARTFRSAGTETDTLVSIENVIAGANNDTVVGSSDDNVIIYSGWYGRLSTSGGVDQYDGGGGNNTVDFSRFSVQSLKVDLGEGTATAHYSVNTDHGTVTGSKVVANLSHIENVVANLGNTTINGDDQDNTFSYVGAYGYQVDKGGFDTYNGGQGNDTVDFSRFAGQVSLDLTDGDARSSYHVTLPGGGEARGVAMIANISGIENVIASLDADTFTGNGKDNTFTYIGAFGYQVDQGGFDTYSGGNGNDTVDLSRLDAQKVALDLNDGIVGASYSVSLPDGGSAIGFSQVARVSDMENVIASLNDDTLKGSDSDNTFYFVGSFNIDSQTGGIDDYDGRGGSNTIDLSKFQGHTWVSLKDGIVSSSYTYQADDGFGGAVTELATVTNIQNAVGSAQSDTFEGTSGANTFVGGGGNDLLIGNEGTDQLTGGIGADTFVFGSGFGADLVTDFTVSSIRRIRHDVIEFSKSVFADWDHVQAAITDTDDGAVITLDNDNSITLAGVTKQALIDNHDSDFVFV